MDSVSRRKFLRDGTGVVAAVPFSAGVLSKPVAAAGSSAASRMIAIQIGAVSFVDEGIEACLDILLERAAVNTIMPAVYSYSKGTAGRHKPYPGHGKKVDDIGIQGVTTRPSIPPSTRIFR